jgi:hypothetical protein
LAADIGKLFWQGVDRNEDGDRSVRAVAVSTSILVINEGAFFLPRPILANCHADSSIARLPEARAFPRFADSAASGFRKVVNLAPNLEGHDAIVVERAIALPVPALCFTKGHGSLRLLLEALHIHLTEKGKRWRICARQFST